MGKRYIKRLEYSIVVLVVIILGLMVYIVNEQAWLKRTELGKVQYDDFPSLERGRFKGILAPTYYQIEPVVVLFSSGSIPGIALLYYPETKTLLAGSPFMQAEVSLFDGKPHEVEYVFTGGEQRLYYDGELFGSGAFREPEGSMGMAEGRQLSEKFERVEIE